MSKSDLQTMAKYLKPLFQKQSKHWDTFNRMINSVETIIPLGTPDHNKWKIVSKEGDFLIEDGTPVKRPNRVLIHKDGQLIAKIISDAFYLWIMPAIYGDWVEQEARHSNPAGFINNNINGV